MIILEVRYELGHHTRRVHSDPETAENGCGEVVSYRQHVYDAFCWWDGCALKTDQTEHSLESHLQAVDANTIEVRERCVDHEGYVFVGLKEHDDCVSTPGVVVAPSFVGACPWCVVVERPHYVVVVLARHCSL